MQLLAEQKKSIEELKTQLINAQKQIDKIVKKTTYNYLKNLNGLQKLAPFIQQIILLSHSV